MSSTEASSDSGHSASALRAVPRLPGLRICEALALAEADLDARRGSLLVRRGKGGRRRGVSMDDWAREHLAPWLQARVKLPVGPLFCVVNGPTHGRLWSPTAARSERCGTVAGHVRGRPTSPRRARSRR